MGMGQRSVLWDDASFILITQPWSIGRFGWSELINHPQKTCGLFHILSTMVHTRCNEIFGAKEFLMVQKIAVNFLELKDCFLYLIPWLFYKLKYLFLSTVRMMQDSISYQLSLKSRKQHR
jgi:hypothetical protein